MIQGEQPTENYTIFFSLHNELPIRFTLRPEFIHSPQGFMVTARYSKYPGRKFLFGKCYAAKNLDHHKNS